MKLRRRIVRALLVMLVLLGIGAIILWRVSMMPPTWYAPPNPRDQQVIEQADRVEYSVVEQSQKIRPPRDQWTLRINENQINAWLSARLPQWIANQSKGSWPKQLGTPQVRIEPAGISIAVPVSGGGAGGAARTLVARVQPRIVDGFLSLDLDRLAVGRIALSGEPLSNLLKLLKETAPDTMNNSQIQPAIDVLTQRKRIDPVFKLADERRLKVLNLKLGDGAVEVTAQTLER